MKQITGGLTPGATPPLPTPGSAPVAEGVALAGLVPARVRGVGAPGRQGTVAVPHRLTAGEAGRGLRGAVRDDGRLLLELAQLALEVGLEAAAVLTLEGTQLVDLTLEQRPLLLERAEGLALLLLRLADEAGGVFAGLADDAVALLLTIADVLVVQLLREGQHARGLLRALNGAAVAAAADRGAHRRSHGRADRLLRHGRGWRGRHH